MNPAKPLSFPGGRTLAGWWKQLAPRHPLELWFGHLFLVRLEALVRSQRSLPLDRLTRVLLEAVAVTPAATLTTLNHRLQLGVPVLAQLYCSLSKEGLVESSSTGAWRLTDPGRQALQEGVHHKTIQERLAFHFRQSESPEQPPHFVRLRECPTLPLSELRTPFKLSHFESCLHQSAVWKQRHGFPTEVRELVSLDRGELASTDANRIVWNRVVLLQPEQLPIILMTRVAGSRRQLLGFAVRIDGWILEAERPLLEVEDDWAELFPELKHSSPEESWKEAWLEWCRARGLSKSDAEPCAIQHQGCRLRVIASPRLLERFRSGRSDVLKGEAWLLGGSGPLRPMAALEVVARGQ